MNRMVEDQLMAFCLREVQYAARIFEQFKETDFEHNGWCYRLCRRCFNNHKTVLTKLALKLSLGGSKVNDGTKVLLYSEFDRLSGLSVNNNDFEVVVEHARSELMKRQMLVSMDGAMKCLEKNDCIGASEKLKSCFSFNGKFSGGIRSTELVETANQRIDEMREAIANPRAMVGIPCGLKILDDLTRGFRGGELVVIMSESGMGKSVWLLNAAYNSFVSGKNVAYFSFEMPIEQVQRRFDCRNSGISYEKFRRAQLTVQELTTFSEKLKQLSVLPQKFAVFDIPTRSSVLALETCLATTPYKFDVLVVDYLGLMCSIQHTEADWMSQGHAAMELRGIGRRLNVPVFTAVQVTSDGYGNYSRGLQNVSRARMIGDNSDFVLDLMQQSEHEHIVNVVKGRDVPKKRFKMYVDFDKMYIGDLSDSGNMWL